MTDSFLNHPVTGGFLPPVSLNDLGTLYDATNPFNDGEVVSGADVAIGVIMGLGILTAAYCHSMKKINWLASSSIVGWVLGQIKLAVPAGLTITVGMVATACDRLGF